MQLDILTWNTININDGNPFNTTFPPGQLVNLSADGISVPRAAMFPFLSTKVAKTNSILLRVIIAPTKVIPTNRELLKAYFNIDDYTKHNLVAKDLLDSDRQWYLSGFPTNVREEKAGLYWVTLMLDMPVWRLVTATAETWNIVATGAKKEMNVIGNVDAKPVFSITPTVAKTGGLSYARWIPVYNSVNTLFVAPLEITNGGLNTAALVGAGKMQADGDDLRVWLDGVETDRWISGINTASTKVWINWSLSPGRSALTLGSIAGAGAVSVITLTRSRNSLSFLQAISRAANKVLLIDNEAFTFTGVDTIGYRLTGVTRARKGTSMAAHGAGSTVRWIEHDLWLLYGDSTLSAPEVDDAVKPMFDIASTNGALTYSSYYDADSPARPLSWLGEVNSTKTALSYVFTGPLNTFVDPATELGLALNNSADAVVKQQEVGQLDWILSHPAGFTNATYAGKKYMAQTTWPAAAGLQGLQSNTVWQTLENESAPTLSLAWQAFSRSVAFGTTYPSIRFSLDGSLSASASDAAMLQFDTVVLTVDATRLPVISVGSEQAMNFFDFILTNNDTGEYLHVAAPCPVNTALVIDCENKLSYLSSGERINVEKSTYREAWLNLAPGTPELQWDDTGTNAVTVVVTHRDRTM
jgi:hypothetical protein